MAIDHEGFEWTLVALAVSQGAHVGERRYRVRVRTAQGEKATDVPAHELPARIAELCTRLGLEGVTMDEDIDLTKLAALRREKLDDLDEEIEALQAKRTKLAREVKAIEKCAAMLDGTAPKRAGGKRAAKSDSQAPSEKILEALSKGPLTVQEICAATGLQPASVGVCCRHMQESGKVRRDGDTVRLAKAVRAA